MRGARWRSTSSTAWPAARRSRSSRARPTPRRTAPSAPRASWSSRTACKILVGPLSGDEGLAVKDYAKTQPDVTFINGTSAAQDTTLRDPAPNFFRFSTDGAQWMAGLGTTPSTTRATRRWRPSPRTIPSPTRRCSASWPTFCKAGGHVPSKFWVPIGNKDFSSVIAAIPDDVDAIYVALGGADGVNFLTQYQQAGGAAPLIGGSITVDQTVLGSKGKTARRASSARPRPARSPTPTTRRPGRSSSRPTRSVPDAFPVALAVRPWLLRRHARRLLLGARQGQRRRLRRRRQAARRAGEPRRFDTPTGKVTLDKNRNAIADIFLTEVARGRRRQPLQQGRQGDAAGQPDAGHSPRTSS